VVPPGAAGDRGVWAAFGQIAASGRSTRCSPCSRAALAGVQRFVVQTPKSGEVLARQRLPQDRRYRVHRGRVFLAALAGEAEHYIAPPTCSGACAENLE